MTLYLTQVDDFMLFSWNVQLYLSQMISFNAYDVISLLPEHPPQQLYFNRCVLIFLHIYFTTSNTSRVKVIFHIIDMTLKQLEII